mmetsp:Transcript_36106/g.86505  ORF Transcript_36106/g.86505 Transcript_36106/m.86505 type:complete len:139 (-) Transcript_36106:55-471(-)
MAFRMLMLVTALGGASAFVQTAGTGAQVGSHAQADVRGRAADMVEVQEEGAPLMSLGMGLMAGLLVALAGSSPAYAQRNQGYSGNVDPELQFYNPGFKSEGLLKELGDMSGPKWDPKSDVKYRSEVIVKLPGEDTKKA